MAANLQDPATAVAEGERLACYADLAASGPIHRITMAGVGEVWLLTGYQAARDAFLDPRLIKGPNFTERLATRLCPDLAPACYSHMLAVDGAAHARLRRLVGTAFTRARVEAFTPRIEALTTGLLDRLAGNEPDAVIDLIEEFAYPLPLVVIFELLGVPEARRERVHRLVESILAAPFGGENEFPATLAEYVDLLRAVVADKRAENGEDLLSALIAARDGGDRLTEDELTSMIYALIAAGHETTANLIGNGIRVLLRHPECLATWRAAPAISDSAVEELLRFDSPLHTALPLLAAGDLEIKGSAVHAGDTVLVALMAANHDHACVAEPDRLDLTRAPNHHLAFGHGAHHCLGATLARVEGRIAIGALIVRFPDLALADPPQGLRTRPNPLINGLDSLPVRLREPRGRRDAIMAASTSRD